MDGIGFIHHFEPGDETGAPPLLLLHGTGGNEYDLLPVGRAIAPGSSLLSPRGKVLENGLQRFFRRLAEGVFDLEDLRRRTAELADFTVSACRKYGLKPPIALGYSNGANIAAAVLQLRPEILAGGLLYRAMVPIDEPAQGRLDAKPILIISGKQDMIVPLANAQRLAAILKDAGADVDHQFLPAGHALTEQDIEAGKRWVRHVSVTLQRVDSGQHVARMTRLSQP
jgi:phospholipase/carboxylesterase